MPGVTQPPAEPPPNPFAPPSAPPPPAWTPAPQPQPYVWQQPSYPYPPQQAPGSGLAIGAFVTSFLCFPVAVVLAIVALVQAKQGRAGGRGFAIAALVLSGVWVAGLVAFVVAGLSGAFDETNHVSDATATVRGQCADTDALTPHLVPCSSTHEEEVFWVEELRSGAYPGSDLDLLADEACSGHFAGYVGETYQASGLDYEWYAPSRDEWRANERRVICVISTDGTVGTARHSAR